MPPKRVVLFRAGASPYQPKTTSQESSDEDQGQQHQQPQPTADKTTPSGSKEEKKASIVKVAKKVTAVSRTSDGAGSTPSVQDEFRRHVQRVVLMPSAGLSRVASTGPTAQPLSRTSTLTLTRTASSAAAAAADAGGVRVVQLRRAHTTMAPAGGLRLLRTSSAMAAPAPMTVKFAPPARPLPETPQDDASFASQVRTFLAVLGLSCKEQAALKWIDDSGACDIAELMENLTDFADALELSDDERSRLRGGARTAAHAARLQSAGSLFVRSSLTPAVSVPVTVRERKQTQQRLLLSLVPKPLPEEEEEGQEENEESDSSSRSNKTHTNNHDDDKDKDTDDLHEDYGIGHSNLDRHTQAALDANSNEEMLPGRGRSRLRKLPNHIRMRWWTPPKHRWRVDEKILRARIPEESELKAVEIARKKAKDAIELEWADFLAELAAKEAAKKNSGRKPRKGEEGYEDPRFAALRAAFLEKYKATILKELSSDVELVPADVSQQVKDRFLSSVESKNCEPTFGYHGTKSRNIPSILENGLLVPGTKGVRVENGSAHGVGIYTALPGAIGLSEGFCDNSSNLLICGIVDPNATEIQLEKETQDSSNNASVSSRPAAKFVNGHKQTRKAAPPPPQQAGNGRGIMSWPSECREEPDLRVAGAARIFFKDNLVAPLFVTVKKGDTAPRRSGQPESVLVADSYNSNNTSDPTQSTRGKVIIRESGEEVWAPPQPYECWNARRVKRILVKKERDLDMKEARLQKEAVKRSADEDV
mmetsp:Transcript_7978/g.17831  ORF Transcript_7978/g.17831 Transcript_7978/m.17831 type:complete len:762 (+) Transcript_7978:131-2416(+)|eukprot:CAMPEP_0206560178 /NCGR_PEP_ID=MMETSP0325_2-20121206/20848_1 /ASSEMBLY_ACC=CAM_ASM_000347 /TAXON_ID=2866 /ORGANISM="Crypthecodinium cohnii, Strain Seligo" /LENGTH=761 /DNA_ID=CAMNT_0054061847 /DNA_START=83 /DNA_END=2368 /DNA_ORIENTATION=+